jgi:hypothetical protein
MSWNYPLKKIHFHVNIFCVREVIVHIKSFAKKRTEISTLDGSVQAYFILYFIFIHGFTNLQLVWIWGPWMVSLSES